MVFLAPARSIFVAAAVMTVAAGCSSSEEAGSPGDGWETVWLDEFDGDALDRTKWAPEVSCWGGGNNERHCYTDRPENIQVKDGVLHLIAQEEEFTGPAYPPEMGMPDEIWTKPYTSGKVRTLGLAEWTYGRISARIKLPQGQGTWPAFWMMPAAPAYGGWPLSGEIDIMEATNLNTPCAECDGGVEARTSAALHFGDEIPDNTYLFAKTENRPDAPQWEEWNTYTVEWGEGVFQWFVNDQIFMRITADQWFTAAADKGTAPFAPFDQPFYVMLNLAVGGNLAEKQNGGGFDPSSFPTAVLVDWVRVEQCADDMQTGLACLSDQPWEGEAQGPWETMAR